MSNLRFDPALEGPAAEAEPEAEHPRADRPSGRLWRAVAAFLLGLTLGISGIVIGQSAFERHLDLFGPADTPPPLRR